ncbi:lipoyl(octanoyl) transferase [Solirubrobacter pauli]|uniref:Octanoyltransferase n=1 Tax=Solirubrobacter pauli TaxID=166793 RepID=A0A660LEF1_9ACTN|nr:lipoyl(octanoyl) transferase LipB [Solirubrobacter pauli]RKQ92290.1 lipoyl(octanoyl) transferase [Solirubrobacter pauli]
MASELLVTHLGRVDYREATTLQERLREQVQAGELPELMLLLEHPPVYTVTRRTESSDLPFPDSFYAERGIDVVQTPRGGQLTYHGPGQLVGYPIMRVSSVPEYILTMEKALVAALADAGVQAQTKLGHKHVGVWVGDRKIASVGVHISQGVSSHGFAVNVTNDLDPFGWVVACGLPEVQMTSVAAEGVNESLACFRKRAAFRFCEAFGRRQRIVSPARLGIEAPVLA